MNTQLLSPAKPTSHHMRFEIDVETNAYWAFMHESLEQRARPCCSLGIINEGIAFQDYVARQQKLQQSRGAPHLMSHLILASDANVFCLGGDLSMFSNAIRMQDRTSLLAYAKRCIDAVYGFQSIADGAVQSIALVQGDALGGGFEVALSCNTLVAEMGTNLGLPEVLFGMFPGMGAYSFLRKRVGPQLAKKMILDATMHPAEKLYDMGIVDVLTEKGKGVEAVENLIHQRRKSGQAQIAVGRIHHKYDSVPHEELMDITTAWVETALTLSEKQLHTMERLLRAQTRRFNPSHEADPVERDFAAR